MITPIQPVTNISTSFPTTGKLIGHPTKKTVTETSTLSSVDSVLYNETGLLQKKTPKTLLVIC